MFILVALIILAYMSFQVGERRIGFKKGYVVSATFDNVSGLERDASVRIAGVEVGRVQEIILLDGKARVTMRIIPEVRLEKDARILIKAYGILGDKYIEIVSGSAEEGYIGDGGEITKVEQQVDLDRLLRDLGVIAGDIMAITDSLKQVIGGEEGTANLRDIVTNTRNLTDNLNRVVSENREEVNQMIGRLNNASEKMEKTFTALNEIMDRINRGEGTIGKLVEDERIFDNLNDTAASLREITDKINRGEGSIGKLVNDDETVNNLNAGLKSIDKSMEGISSYLSKAERFRTSIGYRHEYLFDDGDSKGYVELRISPREDKFYILGLVADPRGRRTEKERWIDGKYSEEVIWEKGGLLFNAQIGKRFKDIALRGGLLESTGGFGIDLFTLDDDLKFTFEAFDFDKDRNPHLKAYAGYRLFKHIFLTAGWDDFVSDEGNESPFAGVSIHFDDDDLKYIMSSAPLPK